MKRILRLAIIYTLFSTSLSQDDSCFSLSGSTTCPAFQEYYISLTGLAAKYPFLQQVTDIKTFDAGMQSFVISPQLYLAPLGCANKASVASTIPYARYSLTYMCATLIQDSSYSLPCNYNKSLSPPPLCQRTCFDYTASIEDLTNNTDTCPNILQQRESMANLNSSCLYWSGLNGTYNCILGEANEPNNCGFQGASDACNYCKTNGTDACCKSVKCSSLSPGEIAGIVIGCLLFIAIIGALAYFYFYKKKRGQQVKHHRQSKKPYHDNSSVLGYESLASQRILVPNNQHPNGYQQHPFIPNNNGNKPPPLSIQPPPPLEEFYEVKHPYPPQMGDELGLHVGDIVCVAMNFDDGWALGFNVTTGLKGVFPLVCVSPAPEELLEELLLQQQQQEESSTKILVEENNSSIGRTMSRSNRTLPKSELTQHKNIPKRTASIMRSYDYRESDSPTSPTLNTPFFDSHNISQPEPSFHNVNDNSSNNNSNNHHSHQEVIELHRK